MIMKRPLSLKIVGARADIQIFIEELKQSYEVAVNSRFIPNQADDGVHVFVTLIPRLMAEARQ